MNNEFAADLIVLVDEEGKEHEFEILDVIENDDGCFYALVPNFESPDESIDFDGTYFIFEAVEENGEQKLAEVENDELLDKLADMFEKRFEEIFDANEDED